MRPAKRDASQSFGLDSARHGGQGPSKRPMTIPNSVPDLRELLGLPGPGQKAAKLECSDLSSGIAAQYFFSGQVPEVSDFVVAGPSDESIAKAKSNLSALELCEVTESQRAAVVNELVYQEAHPPELPQTQVADLPPKGLLPEYYLFPDGIDDSTRRLYQHKNNEISAQPQRLERERNNMAACKSRKLRKESLRNYRDLYIMTTTKLYFHRLRDAALGRDPDAWEKLSEHVRSDLIDALRRSADKVEKEKRDSKKKQESRKRAELARARKERRIFQEAARADLDPLAPIFFADGPEHLQMEPSGYCG